MLAGADVIYQATFPSTQRALRPGECSRLTALSAGETPAVPVKSLTLVAEMKGNERAGETITP